MEDITAIFSIISVIMGIIIVIVFFVMTSNIGDMKRQIIMMRKILEKYAVRDKIIESKSKPKVPQN